MIDLQNGIFLIANPSLDDPHFFKSVVLLCAHNDEESIGFIINKKTKYILSDLVPELSQCHLPVFEGGPVALNTLHIVHQYPDKISNSLHVKDDIYWGGDFTDVIRLIDSGMYNATQIKFFVGYSGWGKNQLEEEQKEPSWIIADINTTNIFQTDEQKIWKDVLLKLGGGHELLINAPIDPQWN